MRGLVVVVLLVAACTTDIDERCTDPKYGNGTCDIDTSCSAPDIDCYQTFDTPEAAKAWYDDWELAATQGPSAATTDPKYAHMQELLDDGWEAYKRIHDVGDLASKRVQLVLLEPNTNNAFAAYDRSVGKVSLAVMVYKGLINLGGTDAELMGVVMHELEHALGLHNVPGNAERFRTYYVAGTPEPLGFEQEDDPAVRALFAQWDAYAGDVGYLSDAGLVGFPMFSFSTSNRGDVVELMRRLVVERATANQAACSASVTQIDQINNTLLAAIDPVSGIIPLSASAPTTLQDATVKLANECFGTGFVGDAITHAARLANANEATLRASLPADLKTSIEGRHAIAGFYNWIQYDRTKMREVKAAYMTMTGKPFTTLRYFSTEEAADDSAARSLVEMGLDGEGLGRMLVKLVPGLDATCNPLLAGAQPIPYGENLRDDHHGFCWRAGHNIAMTAKAESGARIAPRPTGSLVAPRPTALLGGRTYDVMY